MPKVITPDWVKDAVFYQIFPDRFAKSEAVFKPSNLEDWDTEPTVQGFKGGDLLGVAEHLDYLEALGINAIYFNPIFQSACNHRYHAHDYYRVDPILGGNAAFQQLLEACHARGIKVVLDEVFNHASRGFFQFNHLLEVGQQSPYIDWFKVYEWPPNAYDFSVLTKGARPNYAAWWNLPALPKFNTDTPAVREFIFGVAEYWIAQGIDGWRLDVPFEIDDDAFWQEFRRRVKAINPEAYIVGELWGDSRRWLAGDQFDAQMNYFIQRAAIGYFGRETYAGMEPGGGFTLEATDAAGYAQQIEDANRLYDWQIVLAQMNLLGSHDTARYLTIVGEDESALKLAMLSMFTLPGAPTIYYGDELGLTGGYEPESRGTIPWEQVPARQQGDLWQYIQRLIALRKAQPVLRRGTYTTVHAEGDLLAYIRQLEDQTALVVFNTAQQPQEVRLPVGGLAEVAFGEADSVKLTAKGTNLTLPARGGVVLM